MFLQKQTRNFTTRNFITHKNMTLIVNPFKFGKIVHDNDFCNRTNEIKALKQYISDTYSVWLFSPRRYGKSSLIHKVFNEITDVKTIYIDLYNIQSVDDFCRKYSKVIAKELFDWKTEIKKLTTKLGKYFQNLHPGVSFDASGSPSFSLEKAVISEHTDVETILNIPEKIAKSKNIKICIAFDEFQEIDRIDPFIINWMRSAFQDHQNVSYIFLGSKQSLMKTIFADVNSPFYEFAIKMNIDPISVKDLSSFIQRKFKQCGLKIHKENVLSIIQKSNKHPHFTQYFASVVFNMIRNGEDQTSPDFESKWMEQIINSQTIIFQNIYDQLNSNQRKTLMAIANSGKNAEIYSSGLRKIYKLPASSTLTIALKALIKKDIISKSENSYMANNPVFKEWLIQINK